MTKTKTRHNDTITSVPCPYRTLEEPIAPTQEQVFDPNLVNFASRPAKYQSAVLVFLGIAITLLDVAHMVTLKRRFLLAGEGIFIGMVTFVTGVIGIFAAKKRMRCQVIGFMVMDIITSILSTGLLWNSVRMFHEGTQACRDSDNTQESCQVIGRVGVSIGLLLSVASVIVATLTIWTSVLCCRAVCCGAISGPVRVVYSVVPGQTGESGHLVSLNMNGAATQAQETRPFMYQIN